MKKHVKRELLWIAGLATLALYASSRKKTSYVLGAAVGALALIPTEKVKFNNRTTVITGGSRGLGFALAHELLRQNANVALLARDEEELFRAKNKLIELFPDQKDNILTIGCDVTDEKQIISAFKKVKNHFGGFDLLINNAGSILVGPWETMALEDFKAQMDLHVYAPIMNTTLKISSKNRTRHLR